MTWSIDFRSFVQKGVVVGGLVGFVEVTPIGHLFDRLKIEQQLKGNAVVDAVRQIWQQYSWKGFAQGYGMNLALSTTKQAVRMTAMGLFSRLYAPLFSEKKEGYYRFLKPGLVGISSAAAESFLVVCPTERWKILQMTNTPSMRLSFYRPFQGIGSVFAKQSASWVVFLTAYENLRALALQRSGQNKLNLKEQLVVSALSGAVNVFLTAPLDVLKTHAQKGGAERISTRELMASISKQKIWMGGVGMRFARAIYSSCLSMGATEFFGIYAR